MFGHSLVRVFQLNRQLFSFRGLLLFTVNPRIFYLRLATAWSVSSIPIISCSHSAGFFYSPSNPVSFTPVDQSFLCWTLGHSICHRVFPTQKVSCFRSRGSLYSPSTLVAPFLNFSRLPVLLLSKYGPSLCVHAYRLVVYHFGSFCMLLAVDRSPFIPSFTRAFSIHLFLVISSLFLLFWGDVHCGGLRQA